MINKRLEVGRIVVRVSDHPDQFVDMTATGRITHIAGHQIRYDRRTGPDALENTESRILLDKTVAAVCDTEGELHEIVAFSDHAFRRISAMRQNLNEDWNRALGGTE